MKIRVLYCLAFFIVVIQVSYALDTTPPARSSGAPTGALAAGTKSTTISLITDEPATCRFSTTPNTAYSSMAYSFSKTAATTHSKSIGGLAGGKTYTFYVRCLDPANNANTDDYVISFSLFGATLSAAAAQTFQETVYATGLNSPTAMEFAPDGRLFVAEKGGKLRVIKNGVLLQAPFVTVPVLTDGERGLLGVTFDPNFASNRYVYVYYTNTNPVQNRLSRFTASSNPDVAAAGSEVIILNAIPSASGYHNGGAIHFGKDGKLYVAVGEGHTSSDAQKLTTISGKLLRINANGSVPADNPFVGTPGARGEIWVYGLRNPFTFAIDPVTGKVNINDVGQNTWEEVNSGIRGANYGWPTCEGFCTASGMQNPLFAYNHSVGKAITGGAFYRSGQFPATYNGSYFFSDYLGGFIKELNRTNQVINRSNPAANFWTAKSPVDLKVGPDGSLYYLSISNNAVYKIQYGSDNSAPSAVIGAAPTSGPSGTEVNFSGAGSSDPDGDALTYSWNFGDGTQSSGVSTTHKYNSTGQYTVTLTVNDGRGGTDSATTMISIGSPPLGNIISPAAGAMYNAGNTINYSGSATDPDDGTLAAGAFSWAIDLHHDEHSHHFLGPINGVKNGTFQIPQTGETSDNVWYRITLTVTDSSGLINQTARAIRPRKSTITLNSNVSGVSLDLDGQPRALPFSVLSVRGMLRTISAPSPQVVGGTTYNFVSWSDGGAQTHTITTPNSDTSYIATYTTDAALPVISSVSAAPSRNSSTITWTTNEASSTQIDYGTTMSYGSSTTLNTTLATAHSQTITGLLPGTLYHYRVKSRDASNNLATSGDFTFTTTAPDVTPPAISGVSALPSPTGATITWNTNEASNTQIEYGTTAAYGSSTTLNAALVTSHSQQITGLSQNTLYHYRVKSRDAAGNLATSGDFTFTTTSSQDTTTPTVSVTSPTSGSTLSGTITITATASDNVGVAGVRFRINGTNFGSKDTTSPYSISWNTTAAPNGWYAITATARDAAGNTAASNAISVTVTNAVDTTPPAISGVSASPSPEDAMVTWNTNEISDTQIEYGTTAAYDSSTTLNTFMETNHSQLITGLSPGTLYHYRVKSKDAAGNLATSDDFTFATLTADTAPPARGNGQPNGTLAAGTTSATVSLVTDEAATCRYSAAADNYSTMPGTFTVTGGTVHSETILGLVNGSTYGYYVRCRDAAGNTNADDFVISFSVALPQPPAAALTASPSTITSGQSVLLNWTTENANIVVISSIGNVSTSGTKLVTPTTTTTYTLTATGQGGSATVNVTVTVIPLQINDTAPPTTSVISPPNNTVVSGTINVTVTATDDTAISRVELYRDGTFLAEKVSPPYIFPMDTDAETNGVHLLTARAVDTFNNKANSSLVRIVVNNSPPATSYVTIAAVATNSAKITWLTDRPSKSQMQYGVDTNYGLLTPLDNTLTLMHEVIITGLTSGTNYHFRVLSPSKAGVVAPSPDYVFTTTSPPASSSGGGGAVVYPPQRPVYTTPVESVTLPSSGGAQINIPIDVPIKTINVRSAPSAGLKLDVKKVDSINVPAPSGRIYKYVRIDSDKENVSSIDVEFEVPKSWLLENVNAGDVLYLLRYSNGWQRMDTRIVSSDNTRNRYASSVPGFSVFAIAAQNVASVVETPPSPIAVEPVASAESGPAPTQYFIISGVMFLIAMLLYVHHNIKSNHSIVK